MTAEKAKQTVHHLLEAFLKENRGTKEVTVNKPHNIRIQTQKMNQTDPYGKIKFHTGRETVTMLIQRPGNPKIVLARLHEAEDGTLEFTEVELSKYLDIIPLE